LCGYDLRGDGRDPDYCPRCGRCQSKERIAQRDRELMRQLEQIRDELDRNHLDRIG
jgi:tRNA(Ile2) C34 agmatinyltransferase TiaS